MAVGLRGGVILQTEDHQFFIRDMLQRAKPVQVYSNYGRKDFIPANGGSSAQWRLFKRIPASTSALAEGTYNAELVVTVINVTASIAQYGGLN